MVFECSPGCRGERAVILIIVVTLLLFIYLVYALIHPEKF
ncbi:K(+)-transporting ATPase subunit F [Bacillus sp. FJAT-27264]